MQMPDENEEKNQLKPHWKAGAIVLVAVVVISGIMMSRGISRNAMTGPESSDPGQFGDGVQTTPTSPDLSENNCEDPATKCANNCKVMPAEVGACDWQGVGGSTVTPEAAVKTFAANLKKIQDQQANPSSAVNAEEADLAYLFDQFLKYYKGTMTTNEKQVFSELKTAEPLEQKALELLNQ